MVIMVMGRLRGLIKKEFIHFYRDPVAMSLIVYHFTACVILCAYCLVPDAKHLSTVVYDMNRTATSRDLVERFLSTEYFNFNSSVVSMEEVKEKLDSGEARVALIIPPEFTRRLGEGSPASIQFIADGSDANQAGQAVGFAKRILATYNQEIILKNLSSQGMVVSRLPGIDGRFRTLFNQEMEGVYYVVIYHIVVAGLIGGLILSSTALVREKERGTIDQLMVTPTRSWEILVAKTVAPMIIALVATVFSFLIVWWFDMPCRGNPLTFFAYMGFFLIGITGIGICVGTICRNMLQAILLSFMVWFALIFPAGIVTPVENMKPFLQKIAQGIPTTHFNIAANGIIQKGLGFAVLWPEAVKLLGIGAVFMMLGCFLAWRQFRQ
jgi:ABC-2 type transport system permease protein